MAVLKAMQLVYRLSTSWQAVQMPHTYQEVMRLKEVHWQDARTRQN